MLIFRPTTDNGKTDNVPTAWVGPDMDAARESCKGCALYPRACYAWRGRVRMSAQQLYAAAQKRPEEYTLSYALKAARRSAKMLRLTALGDPAVVPAAEADALFDAVRAAGLVLVGYTHHWRTPSAARAWRGRLMASCETAAQADQAHAAGWRATFILPRAERAVRGRTPGGLPWVLCPAQRTTVPGRAPVTCNTCRLCAASAPGPVVAFRGHGPVRMIESAVSAATSANHHEVNDARAA